MLWRYLHMSVLAVSAMVVQTSPFSDVTRGDQLPVLNIMPGMHAEWVARKMIYNGIPMSIRSFSVTSSASTVIHYYASRWKDKGAAIVAHSRTGEFDVIGVGYGRFYDSVQVRDVEGGAEGVLVVTRSLESSAYEFSSKFPLPPETELLTKIESIDAGVRAETLLVKNHQSVNFNAVWMTTTLRRQSWRLQSTESPAVGRRRQLSFQKGSQRCQVTISAQADRADAGAVILVNWVKESN